ncbi:N-acetylmuramoyl-L-alanine amidase [Wenzhouxiangella marina]|uniref:N-acetylmuramoyl-L-alanine amidase n=2 Tax=Wenzhouxiangella marina TaxID=1579979 RepID=A0A0K0XYR4_9GAMM|nr:N-acetylmuramoyl-L-alanine amidase [Wenzhouxiangella marina]
MLLAGALAMGSTMAAEAPPFRPLSYQDRLESRTLDSIELLVIHATELPDLDMAREYGERIHYPGSRTGNSGHFYIDREGRIEQWVALDRVAHHVAGQNANSIGVELVSLGRYPDWLDSRHQDWQEPVNEAQLRALIGLIDQLRTRLPNLNRIAGHDQLDRRRVPASDDPSIQVRRKLDPGPEFPWSRLIEATGLQPWNDGETAP